ncbi:MAG: glycolate oxidase subunit GlcE [Alphaproteobacteria bacterium]|nr:glycolate oxidase subunit GlcE [Alphaproteobacteria bacterium]
MRILKPETDDEVVDTITQAFAARTPLCVEGNGTKRTLGHAVKADTVLKLSGLTGITMYEPDEMVFTARAGTPLAEVDAALAKHSQMLAFEPAGANATIGGVVAAAVNGPRRFAAGAARDHLLGFTGVNGKGERFKAGGRVVKNVTGYDLPKLAAGSFGTLFAMTELTLRALPRTTTCVLALDGLEPGPALRLLRGVAASPFDPTGLSYIAAKQLSLIRLEGQADGVAARRDELCRTIARGARVMDAEEGAHLFRSIGEVFPLFSPSASLWRMSIPPTAAEAAINQFNPKGWVADWAGGLLLLEFDRKDANVHTVVKALGGHATALRTTAYIQDIFTPLDPATFALTERIKDAFDPARLLNPGRMYKDL